MLDLVNVRLVDDSLVSLSIQNGRFVKLKRQAKLLSSEEFSAKKKSIYDWFSSLESAFFRTKSLQDLNHQDVEVDCGGELFFPAAIDIHIHSRDPGLTHKEDWKTVAQGAFRGGVVAVADMPNTKPPTMTREAVLAKVALAKASGVDALCYVGVGAGNVASLPALFEKAINGKTHDLPVAGLKIYYGQSTGELMYSDLNALAKALPQKDVFLVFHSEDQCCIDANYKKITSSLLSRPRGRFDFSAHSQIRDSAAAMSSTRVILEWAKAWDRSVHIAHISTPDEVDLIGEYRARGAKITCEVAPHHLLFSTADYERLGSLLKINPPVRSLEEVERLRRQVAAGAIDCFATDHAPHTLAEKSGDIDSAPSGAPALEFFYPLLAEVVARTGLPWQKAVAMATSRPAELLQFDERCGLGALAEGRTASLVWVKKQPMRVRNEEVISKCGWTPYDGMELPLKVNATIHRGQLAYLDSNWR